MHFREKECNELSYLVFFDESGKIDRQKEKYSYYGALGIKKNNYEKVIEVLNEFEDKRELHFKDFNLNSLHKYLIVLQEVIEKAQFNVYLVDRDKAINIADRLCIDMKKLRELLYIKIPERLIYGILRYIEDILNVSIYIDKCDEYDNYDIKTKLEYQLNAQSVYRDKKYFINNVSQIDSKENILLQATDVLLGIVSFLIEEKYNIHKQNLTHKEYGYILETVNEEEKNFIISNYEFNENRGEYILKIKGDKIKQDELKRIYSKYCFYTQSSIQKSELIYRLLENVNILNKFNRIHIYLWEQDGENIEVRKISEAISKFIIFKTKFDNYNKINIK